MSLADFAPRLLPWGVLFKLSPSEALTPTLPTAELSTYAISVPIGQIDALEDSDGWDRTTGTPAPTAVMRRLLHDMKTDGCILEWHAFREPPLGVLGLWCHLLMTRSQAVTWYRAIDWVLSTRKLEAMRAGHRYLRIGS